MTGELSQAEIARQIATVAHKGQVDKAGKPYITHPMRVAARMKTDEGKAVAWLHDVLEDTPTTAMDLINAGLSQSVVMAVEAMTHPDDLDYLSYVRQVACNRIACMVKLSDLTDNSDLSRFDTVLSKDLGRVKNKYAPARKILLDTIAKDPNKYPLAKMVDIPSMRHLGTLEIHTERLMLRRLVEDDAIQIWKAFGQDASVTRYMPWQPGRDIETAQVFVEQAIEGYKDPTTYTWAIELCDDGSQEQHKFIGLTCTFNMNNSLRACELGCMIAQPFWGHGYATEAEKAVIDYLFGAVWFNRIQATHHAENKSTAHLIAKLGMTHEGILRQATTGADNELANLEIYSILQQEWLERIKQH